ncbi:hypothetical protein HDU76_008096, partial [Blyttiomyces sp. JEL0837]
CNSVCAKDNLSCGSQSFNNRFSIYSITLQPVTQSSSISSTASSTSTSQSLSSSTQSTSTTGSISSGLGGSAPSPSSTSTVTSASSQDLTPPSTPLYKQAWALFIFAAILASLIILGAVLLHRKRKRDRMSRENRTLPRLGFKHPPGPAFVKQGVEEAHQLDTFSTNGGVAMSNQQGSGGSPSSITRKSVTGNSETSSFWGTFGRGTGTAGRNKNQNQNVAATAVGNQPPAAIVTSGPSISATAAVLGGVGGTSSPHGTIPSHNGSWWAHPSGTLGRASAYSTDSEINNNNGTGAFQSRSTSRGTTGGGNGVPSQPPIQPTAGTPTGTGNLVSELFGFKNGRPGSGGSVGGGGAPGGVTLSHSISTGSLNNNGTSALANVLAPSGASVVSGGKSGGRGAGKSRYDEEREMLGDGAVEFDEDLEAPPTASDVGGSGEVLSLENGGSGSAGTGGGYVAVSMRGDGSRGTVDSLGTSNASEGVNAGQRFLVSANGGENNV